MRFLTHSEPGYNHINEDVLGVSAHPDSANVLLCVLADGMGGQHGGGVAARIAVEVALQFAAERRLKTLLSADVWRQIASDADETVCAHAEAGFSTLIALCVAGSEVRGASCGDSMALHISANNFEVLSERQRKNPPLGSGAALATPFDAILRDHDKLLLVSDGVWRFVGPDAMADCARQHSGRELISALRELQAATHNGKLGDDFSVILVEN